MFSYCWVVSSVFLFDVSLCIGSLAECAVASVYWRLLTPRLGQSLARGPEQQRKPDPECVVFTHSHLTRGLIRWRCVMSSYCHTHLTHCYRTFVKILLTPQLLNSESVSPGLVEWGLFTRDSRLYWWHSSLYWWWVSVGTQCGPAGQIMHAQEVTLSHQT